MRILIFILAIFSLSSCVEIIDDITIHLDGTGTFKYNINLSSSKTEISALLSLDSLDGHRVPKKPEINEKIDSFKSALQRQPGISNVEIISDWNNYILKISCDFQSVSHLENGLRSAINIVGESNIQSDIDWITFSNKNLVRKTPVSTEQIKNSPYINREKLKTGKYISISRFDQNILNFTNSISQLSKNNKALMLKISTIDIIDFPNFLDNTIFFD
jgi:hypothetical protein